MGAKIKNQNYNDQEKQGVKNKKNATKLYAPIKESSKKKEQNKN